MNQIKNNINANDTNVSGPSFIGEMDFGSLPTAFGGFAAVAAVA